MPITTAVPSLADRARVKHHLVESLEPEEYYSAARFEEDALQLIADMERRGLKYCVVCGGSMMYIDALTRGLDELPTISDSVRESTLRFFQENGIDAVREELRRLDPAYIEQADPDNHRRLVHALEIIRESGMPVSVLRTGKAKERPFTIKKFAVNRSREELFDRINRRVDQMIESGMEAEAKALLHKRHLNSLNTVGFKEMFAMFDGVMERRTAIERLKKNTRVYAKKQLTWLKRDSDVVYITSAADILACI